MDAIQACIKCGDTNDRFRDQCAIAALTGLTMDKSIRDANFLAKLAWEIADEMVATREITK